MNVTEKVARAIVREWGGGDVGAAAVRGLLAVLADPEVLAGIAGVLLQHRHDVISYDAWGLDGCDCGWEPPDRYSDDAWDQHRAHQAAAVVEWLRADRDR